AHGAPQRRSRRRRLILEVICVDSTWHRRTVHRLFMSRARDLSLVDRLSFAIIEASDRPREYSSIGR
ncbi:MAG: hypothetical protein ACREWG_14930, partial [Gammaproteobacteria bacterium]